MQIKTTNKGFTLLEILLVIALIGILVSILLIAINPNRQLAEARNLNRRSHITDVYESLETYSVRNSGVILNTITTSYQEICDTGTRSGTDSLPDANYCNGKLDLRVLVPTYITSIPKDNQATGTGNTGYEVAKDNRNQISIRATKSELGEVVAVNAPSDTLYSKAGAFPNLDLNFASNKSLIDNVSGKNLITFARNSIGTYVGSDGLIKTAAVNEPRFDHNPTTGESLGLLIEEARENIQTHSEDFNNGVWAKVSSSISSNAIIAPDGTLTADKLIASNSSGVSQTHYVKRTFNGVPSPVSVYSVYAKKAEHNFIALNGNIGGYVWTSFDLTTGNVYNANPSVVNAYAEKLPNGWWRCVYVSTRSATTFDFAFSTGPSLGNLGQFSFVGDNVSGIYIWGAQVEAGSFPTSYIPTSGSTVTRQADNVSITGTNFSSFFSQNTGSFFVNNSLQSTASAGQAPIISVDNSGLNFRAISRRLTLGVRNTSNNDGIDVTSGVWNGESKKTAITWVPNDSTLVDNGNLVGVDTSTISPLSTVNRMLIGSVSSGGFLPYMGGHMKRLTYWPTRLPNSNLQAMTQ